MEKNRLILCELARLYEKEEDGILISTRELGEKIGISQQSASRYLKELEERGYIQKRRSGFQQRIHFTEKGLQALSSLYKDLRDFFEGEEEIKFKARVVTGMGEGAYYVRKYSEILEKEIGFEPYPGTLNVKPNTPAETLLDRIRNWDTISSFEKNGRVFGSLKYTEVEISNEQWKEECFLVLPTRTHHKKELEFLARENLRKKHGLEDGDILVVKVKK